MLTGLPQLCAALTTKGLTQLVSWGWMLAQEALHMPGTISHEHPREVTPDLYDCRDPEKTEKAVT